MLDITIINLRAGTFFISALFHHLLLYMEHEVDN